MSTGVSGFWSPLSLDQIVVSAASDATRAQPHHLVTALDAATREDLFALLRQLDGRNAGGILEVGGDEGTVFANGFE